MRNDQLSRQWLLLQRLEGSRGATLQELVDSLPDDFPKHPRTIRRDRRREGFFESRDRGDPGLAITSATDHGELPPLLQGFLSPQGERGRRRTRVAINDLICHFLTLE